MVQARLLRSVRFVSVALLAFAWSMEGCAQKSKQTRPPTDAELAERERQVEEQYERNMRWYELDRSRYDSAVALNSAWAAGHGFNNPNPPPDPSADPNAPKQDPVPFCKVPPKPKKPTMPPSVRRKQSAKPDVIIDIPPINMP